MKQQCLSVFTVFLLTVLPATAESNFLQEWAEYNKQLDANVDLRKPLSNHRQIYYWLVDETGKEIKELEYTQISPYSEGLARVTNESGFNGYIDSEGNLAIPMQSWLSLNFSQGLAWIWSDTKPDGCIDRNGHEVFRNKNFVNGSPFSEGLAAVRVRKNASQVDDGPIDYNGLPSKLGYIDRTGKIVIPPKYDDAQGFHQALAAVKLGKEWMFIDQLGSQVGNSFQMVGSFAEDLAPVQVDGKWGYITRLGKIAVPTQFDDAKDFFEGLAAVKSGGKYGFINSSGAFAIEPNFQAADHFSDGLCAVETTSGKWGFIDKKGDLKIAPVYDEAKAFSSGLAMVKVQGSFGFIDHQGKYIINPKYDGGSSYSDKRTILISSNWNDRSMRASLMTLHLGLKVHKDSNSATGVYIPANLDEALTELDETLSTRAKDDIRTIDKEEMNSYQYSLGMWMRNKWGLFKGLRLAKFFNSVGIDHPNDMSGTILDSYWSKVHGQKEDLAENAGRYKLHWERMRPLVDVWLKLPSAIEDASLTGTTGKIIQLEELIRCAPVTVVVLCGKSGALSAKIIDTLDQLRPLHQTNQVNLIAVSAKAKVGGTATAIGRFEDGKVINADHNSADKSREENSGCLRLVAPESIFQGVSHLLKMEPLVIPQTLIIQRNGLIVKRINGFDEQTNAAIKEGISAVMDMQPR